MAKQAINLGTVVNDGTGTPLRSAFDMVNDNFDEVYGISGWGYYQDSLATPTISVGTSFTQITIDKLGASTEESYLPYEIRGSGTLWSGNKITPINIGDDYDGRLDITVTARTGSPTYVEFIMDISNSTPDTNRVFTGYILSTNVVPYKQNLPIDFFTLTTFLTNGGKIYARVDSGTVTVGGRAIKLSRKGRGDI